MGRYRYNVKFNEDPVYPNRTYLFEFVYDIVEVDGHWDMDIVRLPDYGNRSMSAFILHTQPSERGGKKVCVAAGKEPRTEKDAKKFARNWSELQAVYILTGITPDNQLVNNQQKKVRKVQEKAEKRSSMVLGFIAMLTASIVCYVTVAETDSYVKGIIYGFIAAWIVGLICGAYVGIKEHFHK